MPSSHRVMFFLLYRQNDIDKIIEGNYQNYIINKLTCDIIIFYFLIFFSFPIQLY